METNQIFKTCTKCGKELPLEMFGKGQGAYGKRAWCKSCMNEAARKYTLRKKLLGGNIKNPALSEFTPRELIAELKARGYKGSLTFNEVKTHIIKL